jgi:hypothetical protein
MELLGKIFGSPQRVKIMRLFLFNMDQGFDLEDVSKRSKVSRPYARKELHMLERISFLKKRTFVKEIVRIRKGRDPLITKKKTNGWIIDAQFSLLRELRALLIGSELLNVRELPERFSKAGRMKLFVVSGIFINEHERSVLDILIVGDKLKKHIIDSNINALEAEIGKELRYAVFDTEEFLYRLKMYDKLIRDVFDYPHTTVIKKIDRVDIR